MTKIKSNERVFQGILWNKINEILKQPAYRRGECLVKLRLDIKKHLAEEIKEIDGLVKKVVG